MGGSRRLAVGGDFGAALLASAKGGRVTAARPLQAVGVKVLGAFGGYLAKALLRTPVALVPRQLSLKDFVRAPRAAGANGGPCANDSSAVATQCEKRRPKTKNLNLAATHKPPNL